MKKSKKIPYFLTLFVLIAFTLSCATTVEFAEEEVIAEQTNSTVNAEVLTTVEEELEAPLEEYVLSTDVDKPIITAYKDRRVITANEVERFGQFIVVYNDTDTILTQIDIFDEAMFAENGEIANLLEENEELPYWEEIWIDLDKHSNLKKALSSGPERLFVINALNDDGEMYFRSWNPFLDFWDITLNPDDRIYYYYRTMPAANSGKLLIANETGYDLTSIEVSFGEQKIELLPDSDLIFKKAIVVNLDKLPALEEFIGNSGRKLIFKATDSDGDLYQYTWFPDDNYEWAIRFNQDHLYFDLEADLDSLNDYVLRIQNNSGLNIWYLYIVDKEMEDYWTEGMEILGYRILFEGSAFKFNLDNHDYLNHFRLAEINDDLTIVAYDDDDGRYVLNWNPIDKRFINLTGYMATDD
ncbi:MAG: hypothetical protein WCY53_04485 [Sphaerochaetaceae bacterium]